MAWNCENCECTTCVLNGTKSCIDPCDGCEDFSNHCEYCSAKEDAEMAREKEGE